MGNLKPDEQRWEWGQLPTTLATTQGVNEKASDQKVVSIDKPNIDNNNKDKKAGKTGSLFPQIVLPKGVLSQCCKF
jgi:hypothetical protein